MLTLEHFAPLVGAQFQIKTEAAHAYPAVLAQAQAHGPDAAAGRVGFSLIFEGPAQQPLPQQVYQVLHPTLGECAIFLVPIGRNAEAMQYEAVFN
jgi:hypothetical protein